MYTFSDVLIEPQYSTVESRDSVSLKTYIGKTLFDLPVLSSNMKTVTGPEMAQAMVNAGGGSILHRFNTVLDAYNEFTSAVPDITSPGAKRIGVSIGVKDEDKHRFDTLYNAGARLFCIDVAHGHHIHVMKMLKWIRSVVSCDDITIIAGNIATPAAYLDLNDWGADAIKVGIGPSSVCRTRYNTGVGVPQLNALEAIKATKKTGYASIIADGGMTHPADICKAMVFADCVMLGGMLAGTKETPGDVYRDSEGELYKAFGGSASAENKGANRFVEGVMKQIKYRGDVSYILREIKEGLQSACSYTGAHDLSEYHQKCKLVRISSGSQRESKI